MLQLSTALLARPVLSLRTGIAVAQVSAPIINPDTFKIEGFYCNDLRSKQTLVLLSSEIRDTLPQGFVINDFEVLSEPEDLVRYHKIMEIGFNPIGMPVVTIGKKRIGKVSDFATELETMIIQKIYVSESLFKNFGGGNLGIDRSNIEEVTPKKIIVQDLEKTIAITAASTA